VGPRHGPVRACPFLVQLASYGAVSLQGWLSHPTLPDHQVIVFAREDDYFFGVLHSRVHETWSYGTGTQLREEESGFRYTPNECFKTFPFPWSPGSEPEENDDPRVAGVAAAARGLDKLRSNWLNAEGLSKADLKGRTLTNLYNDPPDWLVFAHADLNRAVFACYGWPEEPEDLTDQDILGRLLALNAQRLQSTAE
jgi:hypothetical protein